MDGVKGLYTSHARCLGGGGKGERDWTVLSEIRYLLTNVVYGGCIDSMQDWGIMQAIVDSCLVPWMESKVCIRVLGDEEGVNVKGIGLYCRRSDTC